MKTTYDYDQIERMLKRKRTVSDIAIRLGASRRQIGRIRRRLGLSAEREPLAPRAERVAAAEALLDEGYAPTTAAKMSHLNPGSFRDAHRDRVFTREQIIQASTLSRRMARLERA
ncbi:hypothetical protein [Agromyces sp. NPDC058104]|uniref:hypothetical protein n=1 Tax=Agromyces sp. NPDC058104 TaxID=3346342 RepID=UPI0036D7F0EA